MVAELHLHLEGSIEPETLVEIDPSLQLEEVREHFEFHDFAGFIRSYVWVNKQLRSPEHYAIAARRCFERLAEQGVVYAEITLSAGIILWKEQDFHAIFDALSWKRRTRPCRFDGFSMRSGSSATKGAMRVAELAVERKQDGVVAFGIGGDEVRGPAEWFRDVFAFAKKNGLALVPHAGETDGPRLGMGVSGIGANRIGHGIRAVDDPELMRRLRDEEIPLEVCITSNVCTGAAPSLDAHPVRSAVRCRRADHDQHRRSRAVLHITRQGVCDCAGPIRHSGRGYAREQPPLRARLPADKFLQRFQFFARFRESSLRR